MGLMDKVRAQATQIAQKTQETARDSKVKFDQAQAKRRADVRVRRARVRRARVRRARVRRARVRRARVRRARVRRARVRRARAGGGTATGAYIVPARGWLNLVLATCTRPARRSCAGRARLSHVPRSPAASH